MRIRYDPEADALYIRFVEGPRECRTLRLNDRVAINLGAGEELVGLEVLDAGELLEGVDRNGVILENLVSSTA